MSKDLNISFEFFPAKDQTADESLWESFVKLETFDPKFISVTFGAGGGARDKSDYLVKKIKKNSNTPVAGHLTCVDMSKDEINAIALDWLKNGINKIVALRGDVRKKDSKYKPHEKGYINAADMVRGLKKLGNFEIAVAGYPDKHPESKNENEDLENLKKEEKFVGIDIACDLVNKLQAEGVNEFHFYTLNKYELTYAVCKNLLNVKKTEKKENNQDINQFFQQKERYI